ncbi:conserved protein of unknown function [Candidatus Hydrogenisulfobacillus filiaventi]|uniref:AraC-type arabinose-binding/dimerisation domain-containing protein n=1 Tax=Candidatus Hydrogenisulfobacillus filiaventi TaxID=2707344 RepID=A0A6F8ZH54_9FIRM|nr:conserved protein of unknown function [Candidatus Hydrogenisulfobacillus filiaventi]
MEGAVSDMQKAWHLEQIPYGSEQPGILRGFETPFTMVNLLRFRTGQALAAHRTSSTALIAVLQGRVMVASGTEQAELGVGEAVLMEPDETHSLQAMEPAVVQLILSPHPRHHTLAETLGIPPAVRRFPPVL